MAPTLTPAIAPGSVVSFEINPGTLLQFLDTRAEGGPRLKCVEGSVTLVSPGRPHETAGRRLDHLILAVCSELGIRYEALGSTTWSLPLGAAIRRTRPTMRMTSRASALMTRTIPPTSRSRSW